MFLWALSNLALAAEPSCKDDASPTVSGPPACEDGRSECKEWAASGECQRNEPFMQATCAQSCGTCHLAAAREAQSLRGLLAEPREAEDPKARDCEDSDNRCGGWAAGGECASNPGYMIVECARSCASCHMRDPKVRCKRNPSEQPALAGGPADGITALFERATAERWEGLQPRVLSRDPWVVVYDAFLSAEEASGIRKLTLGTLGH